MAIGQNGIQEVASSILVSSTRENPLEILILSAFILSISFRLN